ncbi:ATP-binding cassette domain-containing protein [Clostridium gasigenes]|uniref:ATP-binding cassette domain-containing protein n=1 Tax=Clostridium gasigenes TaxID=94869 RepID=UPI00339A5079
MFYLRNLISGRGKIIILISDINISYGNRNIYKNFEINIEDSKVNCIMGSSGCGKTTLLNYISNKCLEENKNISYVFQEDRLIPWQTVYENLELVCKRYYEDKDISNKVNNGLKEVGLLDYARYYPNQLSGGMNQRVNIARALAIPSNIIIMDEPFKSIDKNNKIEIINKMKNIFKESNATVIFVTHYEEENFLLSDKVIRLGGEPIQIIEEYYVDKTKQKVLDN